MRVHPTLLSKSRLLANVNGARNAVLVHGNAVGATLYSGPGAGGEATAAAVVADLIDIGRQMALLVWFIRHWVAFICEMICLC